MAHTYRQELLALIEEGFQKAAWHGPNLRGALRGVRAEEAAWRPAKGRHNIWELTVHAAFWKHEVTKRLTGSEAHEFPEKGRNWFARGEGKMSKAQAQKMWLRDLALLRKTHKALRRATAAIGESELGRPCRGSRQIAKRNIVGIAMHDVYHAGQIQVLRKLHENRKR